MRLVRQVKGTGVYSMERGKVFFRPRFLYGSIKSNSDIIINLKVTAFKTD